MQNRENCVKDGVKCAFYCPYDEASYDSCLYGASVEDYEIVPPCLKDKEETIRE